MDFTRGFSGMGRMGKELPCREGLLAAFSVLWTF